VCGAYIFFGWLFLFVKHTFVFFFVLRFVLTLAKQMLYHLSHTSSPVFVFEDRVSYYYVAHPASAF
jgi:hypothetical protein